MKIQSLLALGAAVVAMGSVSSAQARSHDLVNQALNKTLDERARVERSYEQKVDRPIDDFREKDERKIEVVMDGEIGGRGGRVLRDMDRSDRTFRERNVETKLAREMAEIDRSLEREARADRFDGRESDVIVKAKRKRD